MAAIKRTHLDALVSELTRECAGWRCENCGLYFPEGARRMLHCSHYYSRAIYATRWFPDNLFSHCAHCHEFYGKRPADFTRHAREHLGEERHRAVMLRSKTVFKVTAGQKEWARRWLQNELAMVREQRASGFTGRLEWKFPEEPWGEIQTRKKAKKAKPKKAGKKLTNPKFKKMPDGRVVRRDAA